MISSGISFTPEKNIRTSKVKEPGKKYVLAIEPILMPHLEVITGSPQIRFRVTPFERFINLSSTTTPDITQLRYVLI